MEADDHYYDHYYDHDEANPGSLVPVPAYLSAEAVKKQLPVMTYTSFLEKSCDKEIVKECACVVCLDEVEANEEIRALYNCSHVFHRQCLDVWVDHGQLTCPLCRSKLLPPNITQNHDHHDDHGDPWRRERMIFLFGDDFIFGDEE